jgi:hypothetical protein
MLLEKYKSNDKILTHPLSHREAKCEDCGWEIIKAYH